MSRPRTIASAAGPTARRPSNDATIPSLASPPRSPSGFQLTREFIRRMTIRSTSTAASSDSRSSTSRRHSVANYWEGAGPYGLTCIHNPPEPFIDLVFVHGLHGGSYKTWRKEEERGYFWPGEWLAEDPEFENVRFHTYGYPADWSDFKASNLNVRDFGRSLYGHLMSSPYLSRGEQACLVASQFKESSDLASRIKCLMFLGTPHHGSNSAERLDKILRVGVNPMSATDYVRDLRRDSLSIQTINDDFRHIAEDYLLYSFYETRKSPGLGYIVDKDSACIGGPKHEVVLPLDGDHRSICKFDNDDDPNYRTVHDHLVRIVDSLIDISSELELDAVEDLDVYLDCEESHDETLETTLEQTVPGTCKWIKTREDFIPWMHDCNTSAIQYAWLYWLHSPPGTGKSVMAANIIKMLQDQDQDVAYFFFVDGNKYHRNVAGLLRSLAFQMAQSQPLVFDAIFEMQKAGVQWSEADERLIWRKLFANCILKLPLKKTQYWVVDALDESADPGHLWPLLKSMRPKFNVRIFLTSRTSADMRKQFQQLENRTTAGGGVMRYTEDTIIPEDTLDDMRRLFQEKKSSIPVTDNGDQGSMLDELVQRSQGSFLWTKIVLKELEFAFSKKDVNEILQEVPSEMAYHYKAIFRQMSQHNGRKKHLIQAMIAWTVCGVRPLLKAEFERALLIDVGEDITGNVSRTVEGLCSQILTVNKQGAVHVVHSTVKEFVLDRNNIFDYSIKRDEGHRRLAMACLRYLTSPEMRLEGRLHLLMPERLSIAERVSEFADYAATSFSAHLVNSPADDEELFSLLVKFLQSPNVLCWIEYVAEKHKSLIHIKEAGTNLKRFMERRAKYLPPFGPGVELANSWSTDLLRVVSKFGRNILMAPSKLSLLTPPICPQNSAIHRQFAKRNPGFRVVGIAEDLWADAISYVEHLGSLPTAMNLGPRYLAIGKESGEVRLYNNDTFEEFGDLRHGEGVVALRFSNSGNLLVVSGLNDVKLWDLSESDSPYIVWTKTVNHTCTSFLFADDDELLMAISSGNSVFVFTIDEKESGDSDESEEDEDGGGIKEIPLDSPFPSAIEASMVLKSSSISPDGKFVALVYEGQPISIWGVTEGLHLGFCTREELDDGKDEIEKILFNPNPELEYIVVTYQHGGLTLVDYHNLKEVRSASTEVLALASSPDGHTLATGDTGGKIRIWDFEKLALLYVINYHSSSVRELRFSTDGLRLVDLRETHSVIWEPAALIRGCDEDEAKSMSGVSMAIRPQSVGDYDDPIEISCLVLHPSRPLAIVGKYNGAVDTYNLEEGKKLDELFTIDKGRITRIAMHKNGLLAYACSGNKISVSLVHDDEKTLKMQKTLFTIPDFGEPVQQLLFSDSGDSLLIAGTNTTQIWCRVPRSESGFSLLKPSSTPSDECWRYLPCSDDADKFELIDKTIDTLVKPSIDETPQHQKQKQQQQSPWKRLHRHNTLPSDGGVDSHVRLHTALVDLDTGYLILEYEGKKSTRQLLILEKVAAVTPTKTDTLSPPLVVPGPAAADSSNFRILLHLKPYQIKTFLGIHNNRVVYLGPKLWVRTVDLHHLHPGAKPVKRKHFFVPHEYIGGSHHVDAVVGRAGEIVFPRRGELAVVHGGLV
ncbi:hypothetical protein B0T24DRAFT_669813 [Lasiosphaeria ovina]|uniref:Uncharacterized protein n=1 Tax=Lasiosphaeria ovina TaxID=92902 RepID=A0AAE0JWG2_9PEZI|nr:hypothetical protein B0T24DRAFT_669813 [Lasiosphaeria ovina]